ncbi:hypothetical protein SCHPADRAFT_820175 [Schizopora paradoxa]|uniref:Uncharacterized protein n=1 Tax=Schizopora paradoxa TaxID=27342 RepID=A0A0H2SMD5_9AGAM|nr:hypothetical protein SCHPADRAFT_820175 [Schizopora paradoxa]
MPHQQQQTTQTQQSKPKRYVKPKSPILAFLWQKWLSFESTFALTMMESWEKVLILSLCAIMVTLLAIAIVSYLPHHISFLRQRASFYLSGQDMSSSFTAVTGKVEADSWMTTRGEL